MSDAASPPIRAAMRLCRRHLVGAAWFSALVNLLYITPTLYMLQVYDRVVPTQGLQTLLFLTLVLLFALATLALLDLIRGRLLVRAGIQLDTALAPLVLDATLGRPDLAIARQALREFDSLRGIFTGPSILALFDAPWVPIYIIVCFLVHPWIGIVAILGCIALPLIAWANNRATAARLAQSHSAAGISYANQNVLLGSADTIRALGMRRALVRRQLRQRSGMLVAQTEANFGGGRFVTTTKFTRMALQSLSLGLGALLAVDHQISGGAIFASSFLIARALAPIEQLIGTWKPIILARQSYANINVLIASAPSTSDHTQLPAPTGALAVENVTIFNDGRDTAVVNSVSFVVPKGEVVAIVGPSGAGKSTLIRSIAGALSPDRGSIRFDGADYENWDPELLGQHIGYLPQDSVLFAGSIAENISRFANEVDGNRSVIDENVVSAATLVGADKVILRLPGGYDHELKLGGRGLSAGQSQRVTLARAVYGNPKIIILDEPNAHLDGEGDAALVNTLAILKKRGCTILIVSHKPGVLPIVDKMLVLRDGRVDMFGPRDEVITKMTASKPRRPASSTSVIA